MQWRRSANRSANGEKPVCSPYLCGQKSYASQPSNWRWSKNATHVIFSENLAHDFRSSSGGPGSCFGHQCGANYVWYVYNEGYNCNLGINVGGTDSYSEVMFATGNYFHDLNSEQPGNLYASGGINIRGTQTAYVVANTSPSYNFMNVTAFTSPTALKYIQEIFFSLYALSISR